jgi:hypothetical protein
MWQLPQWSFVQPEGRGQMGRDMILSSNKPDAVNPAMALLFAIVHHWRRVTDLER